MTVEIENLWKLLINQINQLGYLFLYKEKPSYEQRGDIHY